MEQFAKHDDKSPVYTVKTLFNWLPELFWLNKEEVLIVDDVEDDLLSVKEEVIAFVIKVFKGLIDVEIFEVKDKVVIDAIIEKFD